ncbi:MAG: hypothetical protein ACQERX_06410 [Bacillota bacterium]
MKVDFDKVVEIIDDNLMHENEPNGINDSFHTANRGKYTYDSRCDYCCIMKELQEIKEVAENKTQGDD